MHSIFHCVLLTQTFSNVYYSVDMPPGQEENKGQRPEDAGRLSILNVRSMKPCLSQPQFIRFTGSVAERADCIVVLRDVCTLPLPASAAGNVSPRS